MNMKTGNNDRQEGIMHLLTSARNQGAPKMERCWPGGHARMMGAELCLGWGHLMKGLQIQIWNYSFIFLSHAMWTGCAAQLNALAKIPSVLAAQYSGVRFTACTGRAGWFGQDQCNLLSFWPNLLSAPAELMPITQFCGSKRSSPCSPEGRCSGAFTLQLMALDALAQDARVTYSPHKRDWLLKKLSNFGVFSLVILFVPYSRKSWKKVKTHLSGTEVSCMSHLEFRKYGDCGSYFPNACSWKQNAWKRKKIPVHNSNFRSKKKKRKIKRVLVWYPYQANCHIPEACLIKHFSTNPWQSMVSLTLVQSHQMKAVSTARAESQLCLINKTSTKSNEQPIPISKGQTTGISRSAAPVSRFAEVSPTVAHG